MPLRGACDLVERRHVLIDELGTKEEVFRRIPGQDELGEGDQLGAHVPRLTQEIDHPLGVSGKISHGGVDLGEGDADNTILPAAIGRRLG
jgi:hypothetical protein